MYSLNLKTNKELEDLISGKDLSISQMIVDKILSNLKTKKRFIYILEIIIEESDKIINLTIDRKDFIDVLEKNIQIHAHHEKYERCIEIQNAIKKLKNKQL